MTLGLPVVATDVNGTNELVEHEVTGLLVPVDDAHALADALARLLAEPRERARFGASARARVEDDFTFERLVQEKTALYRRLAGAIEP
jgi:glycosyltransferase involved in cell wall biosynthesis